VLLLFFETKRLAVILVIERISVRNATENFPASLVIQLREFDDFVGVDAYPRYFAKRRRL
jgi:hypothetical protein